jgi:hypothetical protein
MLPETEIIIKSRTRLGAAFLSKFIFEEHARFYQ